MDVPEKKKKARRRRSRSPRKKRDTNNPLPLPSQPVPEAAAEKPSSSESTPSSTASYSAEPLTPEAERLLAAVPDYIGEAPIDAQPNAQGVAPDVMVSVVSPGVQVSPKMFKGALQLILKRVAKWREFDAYNIGDAEAESISDPGAQVLNVVLDKLAPAFMKQFAISCPGLGELIFVSGIVLGPIITADLAREKDDKAKQMVQPSQSHVAPESPKNGSMIHDQGDVS